VRGQLTFVVATVIARVIAVAGYIAVDRVIVTSRTPRVQDVAGLPATERTALAGAGTTHLTQLAGWGNTDQWQELRTALTKDETDALAQRVDLYLHQSIGTVFGNRLDAAGITNLDQLRKWTTDELWQRLQDVEAPGRAPTPAQ
jgi:predicted flap endonuclease-1-like 5' DNA nuclease